MAQKQQFNLTLIGISFLLLALITHMTGATVRANKPIAQDSANIGITITGTLEKPDIIARDDYAITNQNEPVTIDILVNDEAFNSVLVKSTLEVLTQPSNGQATRIDYNPSEVSLQQKVSLLNKTASNPIDYNLPPAPLESKVLLLNEPPSGEINITQDYRAKYTPNQDFYGNDEFTYKICNDKSMCDEATVFIEVKRVIPPEGPKPKPKPQTPVPFVPLPVTGGQMIITASIMSSMSATLLACWLFITRKKKDLKDLNGHKLKSNRTKDK